MSGKSIFRRFLKASALAVITFLLLGSKDMKAEAAQSGNADFGTIENSIEIASSNGFQCHTIDYAISNEAIEKLKANGYEVTVIPSQRLREKTKTIISWENTI